MRCPICGAEGQACIPHGYTPQYPQGSVIVTRSKAMPQASEMYYSEEGVFLNKAGEVVYGRGSADRVTEIVAPGGYVTMDIARKYGLVDAEGAPVVAAPAVPTAPSIIVAPKPANPSNADQSVVEVEEVDEDGKKSVKGAPANKAVATPSAAKRK